MARRRRPEKRIILPDPKYGDEVLSNFMIPAAVRIANDKQQLPSKTNSQPDG